MREMTGRDAIAPQKLAALVALSLASCAVVVLWFRADYFRPYTDTLQSSLASSDLHRFAWASTRYNNLLDFFLVSKRVLLDGRLLLHPHYTNGYPLLARGYFAVFGEGLTASRMLPIGIVACGGTLFLCKVHREVRTPLLFAALPLLYLSAMGRDAASFEMLEPAHFLVIGLAAVCLYDSRLPLWARAACIVVCVWLYQVSAPFVFAVIVAEYVRARDRTTLLATTAVLLAALALVAVAFMQAAGWAEFERIVLQRTGLNSTVYGYDETVTFQLLGNVFRLRFQRNMPLLFCYVSVVEIILLIRERRPLLPALYVGFLAYALLLRNFVGVHHFTFLPFVFLVIAAVTSFAARIAPLLTKAADMVRIRFRAAAPKAGVDPAWPRWLATCAAGLFLVGLAVGLWSRPRYYVVDPRTRADYEAMTAYVATHDLRKCSHFDVTGLQSDERITYFFLARQIGRGTGETCKIELTPRL